MKVKEIVFFISMISLFVWGMAEGGPLNIKVTVTKTIVALDSTATVQTATDTSRIPSIDLSRNTWSFYNRKVVITADTNLANDTVQLILQHSYDKRNWTDYDTIHVLMSSADNDTVAIGAALLVDSAYFEPYVRVVIRIRSFSAIADADLGAIKGNTYNYKAIYWLIGMPGNRKIDTY